MKIEDLAPRTDPSKYKTIILPPYCMSEEARRGIEVYRQREIDLIKTAHLYWFR